MNPRHAFLSPAAVLPLALLGALTLALAAPAAHAQCRALIVSGDSGGDPVWAHQFDDWRTRWQKVLVQTCGVPAANIKVLHQTADPAAPDAATRANVLAALADLTRDCTADDQAVVVILAHAYRGQDGSGRICLPGNHLSHTDLGDALRGLKAGKLVSFILAPDSELFAKALRGPNRVTILGDTKPSAGYFSEFLLRALEAGPTNLLDAFNHASLQTTLWYQNQFMAKNGTMTVHGRDFQELFHRFYPYHPMKPGADQPLPADNDPTHSEKWNGRRIVPEVAGLDDNGDGTASTLFMAGETPTPLPNKESKDGALAKTTILGHN
jgi:hypothetical protein